MQYLSISSRARTRGRVRTDPGTHRTYMLAHTRPGRASALASAWSHPCKRTSTYTRHMPMHTCHTPVSHTHLAPTHTWAHTPMHTLHNTPACIPVCPLHSHTYLSAYTGIHITWAHTPLHLPRMLAGIRHIHLPKPVYPYLRAYTHTYA
jgi:hypothetical protein